MKMKIAAMLSIIIFLFAVSPKYLPAQDMEKESGTEEAGRPPEKEEARAGEASRDVHTYIETDADKSSVSSLVVNRYTIGCASGALVGSVIPGFGTIAGCAIGGFFGWLSKSADHNRR